jgi:predicted dehydrogenase
MVERKGRDPHTSEGKVRYAVVGLGYIAQAAILPAFKNASKNSVLTTLVSDDPRKLRSLGRKYGVKRLFDYNGYKEALQEVDAVFIALPNTLHLAYTELAAQAGVHVLCEKPLAMTVADCETMIETCRDAGVRLMTAYRLHFERATLEAIEIAQTKLGELRMFTAAFANEVEAGNIRLKEGEGGALFDIGIYCINAARSLFRAEPEEVFALEASRKDARFKSVPEMISVTMRFPKDRLAIFTCSFGAASAGWYEIRGTRGALCVDPAFEFAEALEHTLTIGERTTSRKFSARDQFAPEILHFSDCIRVGRDPEPSGEEGLADVRVMEAIEQSLRSGKPVRLPAFDRSKRPSMRQEIARPAVRKAKLVHAKPPSGA